MSHFAIPFAEQVNQILHQLESTWYYKHHIYEVPDVVTALIITHDNQKDDEFIVESPSKIDALIGRLNKIDPRIAQFYKDNKDIMINDEKKVTIGWVKRNIYFIKGGSRPNRWSPQYAISETLKLIEGKQVISSDIMLDASRDALSSLPTGPEFFREYEDIVRQIINALFLGEIDRATPQVRTEPGNEGCEIRDLICHNSSTSGFWYDLKSKYGCNEIVFEAKNTEKLIRDNLRQIYCYLKPALGLWGFIICRKPQDNNILAYNRTLYKNFAQQRGVLIVNDSDLIKMLEIKSRDNNPLDYMRNLFSDFLRSI